MTPNTGSDSEFVLPKQTAYLPTIKSAAGIASQQYAREVQALIRLITELRALGAQTDVDLPRIAVIGNQSAGKSSLVEAISGITVPRAAGTCTRCPMECRLSYSEEPFKAQVLLRFEKDEFGDPFGEVKERKFGPLLHDKTELEDMLRRAQLAILNPNVFPERFVDLDLSSLDSGEPPFGSKRQLQFSANVVCIDLSSPESTDLSFIDLPGIISNVAEGEDLGNIDLIKDLVKEHISGNALILLTITMRDDIQNQSAALLAKAADPGGVRTIGVLTKPDTLQEGEHSAWINVLAGKTNPLTHGYYVTKQPAISELQEKLSYEEGRDRERKFFEREAPWKDQDVNIRSRMGVPNLTKQLSQLLSKLIKKTLPKLRKESRDSLLSSLKELESLPPPPSENPTAELLNRVTNFTADLKSHVLGLPGHEGLLRTCRPAYSSFKEEILLTRPNFVPFPKDYLWAEDDQELVLSEPDAVKEDMAKESQLPSEQVPVYLDDVVELINASLTRELPFNVPFSAKVHLIEEYSKTWSSLSRMCFEKVNKAYQDCLEELVSVYFEKYSNGGLYERVRDIVESELKKAKQSMLSRIAWLIELEEFPYTQNDHYFSDYREKYLTSYRGQRQNSLLSDPDPSRDPNLVSIALKSLYDIGHNVSEVDLFKLNGPDKYEQEFILMAEVSAFFRVAYKRIIDNLPRTIDHDFLRGLMKGMQGALITGLGIDAEDNKEIARSYLSEDPDITIRRAALIQTKERLEAVTSKLSGGFSNSR